MEMDFRRSRIVSNYCCCKLRFMSSYGVTEVVLPVDSRFGVWGWWFKHDTLYHVYLWSIGYWHQTSEVHKTIELQVWSQKHNNFLLWCGKHYTCYQSFTAGVQNSADKQPKAITMMMKWVYNKNVIL